MTISKVSAYLTLCGDMERRERLIERCRFILRRFCLPRASPKLQRIFYGTLIELKQMTMFFDVDDWPEVHQMHDTYQAVQSIHSVLIPK